MERRLLAVLAHPDDESFGPGGTLARYAREGVHVILCILTDGGAGALDHVLAPREELPCIRREELRCAAEVLGIRELHAWDYPDGQLMEADWWQIEKRIAALIRRTRPHVVITFGPEGGGNQHPDHRAVSALTTVACERAGDPEQYPDHRLQQLLPYTPAKLYYMTVPPEIARDSNVDFLRATAAIDIRDTAEIKLAAFRCHTSQQADYPRLEARIKAHGYKEYYHRVYPRTRRKGRLETDLFEGLKTSPPDDRPKPQP